MRNSWVLAASCSSESAAIVDSRPLIWLTTLRYLLKQPVITAAYEFFEQRNHAYVRARLRPGYGPSARVKYCCQ